MYNETGRQAGRLTITSTLSFQVSYLVSFEYSNVFYAKIFKSIFMKVYAVATTTLEPNKKVPKFNTEDKEWETLERGSVV